MPDRADDRRTRDPRRLGLAALGAGIGYAVALFIPASLLVHVVFGLAICALFVGAALLVPLPEWQETPERLLVARKAMVVEAVAIAVIATGVALLIH